MLDVCSASYSNLLCENPFSFQDFRAHIYRCAIYPCEKNISLQVDEIQCKYEERVALLFTSTYFK